MDQPVKCFVPEKSTPYPQKVYWFGFPYPFGSSSLASFKNFGFLDSLPLRIPITFCGGVKDIFWNHTIRQSQLTALFNVFATSEIYDLMYHQL